jgi:probable HAF family extracellular repeat protein
MQDLGTLGGSYSYAWGINDNGQVAGTSRLPNSLKHAFRWQSGVGMLDLGTLPGGDYSDSGGINLGGQVTGGGTLTIGGSDLHACLWRSGFGMQDLGTLGGSESFGRGINSKGQVIGESTIGNGNTHAFVWDAIGGMQDLNALIAPNSGWVLQGATAINNEGQIVGAGTNPLGAQDAFLLTPLPEPSTIALMAAAAVPLSLALRRHHQTRRTRRRLRR